MTCNVCESDNIELVKKGKYWKYICKNCGAVCGCKGLTSEPFGIFYNERMKQLRQDCHDLMDKFEDGNPRWKTARHRRSLYRRLANSMQMDEELCHFSKMNEIQLEQAKMIMENWIQ